MLNAIDSQSGAQEIVRGNFPVMALNQAWPAQIVAQVAGGHAVKAVHPFLESAIVGIDVLDVIDTRHNTLTGGQMTGRWVIPISLATAASAFSPSVHKMTSAAKSGLSTAPMRALSAFSRMKSAVFPVRSRQINTAVCSSDRPRLLALPPRFRGARLKPCLRPFCDSRK
jgi:hypothetical protein